MILHVDMDAFYASIEERDHPELVGLPVIVGGTPEGRGVVAAANYVVRKYGVRSAMPTATALRLCPQAVVLPPRIGYYAEVSAQIREILDRYTPSVEPLSLDEAFLDVTGSLPLFGSAIEIARKIKHDIQATLCLTASVGVAPNKFLAKIASDLRKPDALVVVDPDQIQAFLDPLPVGRLWGVGRVTGRVFEQMGIETIGQVRSLTVEELHRRFGKLAEHLWQLAHGVDDRRVVADREAKSISHETTFATDLGDPELLRAWLLELVEQVACRSRRQHLYGRTVQLKLRFSDFETITRSRTLPESTHHTRDIWEAAAQLLEDGLSARNLEVRLIGVGLSGLESGHLRQKSLFADEKHTREARLDSVQDEIQERFGAAALRRGNMLRSGAEQTTDRPGPSQHERQ